MDTEGHRRALASVSFAGAWEKRPTSVPTHLPAESSPLPPVAAASRINEQPLSDLKGASNIDNIKSVEERVGEMRAFEPEGADDAEQKVTCEILRGPVLLEAADHEGQKREERGEKPKQSDKSTNARKKKSPTQFLQEKASALVQKAKKFQKQEEAPVASRTRLRRQEEAPISSRLRDRSMKTHANLKKPI